MAEYGRKLMDIHLPDNYYPQEISKKVLDELISFKFIGDKVVLKCSIFLDAIEGIDKIQMGGYCPAAKWLKDKKGLCITEDDIEIYKKIIDAIQKTQLIMDEIDAYINV